MTAKLLTSLFEYKAWANQGLIDALETISADADRRARAVIVLTFEHASIVDRIFKARILGEAPGFDAVVSGSVPKLDELRATVAETDAWYVDYVGRASPAELDEVLEFTFIDDGAPGRMTRGEMLGHVLTHANSHRGQIGELLARLGVAGPPDMLTTFLGASR
jgi:uncharacterized damage-inducible protein DinB